MDSRPSWDEYFMEMAQVTAKRSTCLRRHVGAVIVKDRHIIATGYNGAPRGITHCGEREGGCLRQRLQVPSGQRHELCIALHAEQNAIIQAAVLGESIEGGTIYITHQPCVICAKMLINAGIRKIVVKEGYPDELAVKVLAEAGIRVVKMDDRRRGETNGRAGNSQAAVKCGNGGESGRAGKFEKGEKIEKAVSAGKGKIGEEE